MAADEPAGPRPRPVLLFAADTGGGHRAAAQAISEELTRLYPGRFAPLLSDPLTGPAAPWPLRAVCGLYGPVVRLAPWLWGAAWHASSPRPAGWMLRHTLLALARRPAARAVARHQPAVIVSLHPLTGGAATSARDRHAPSVPLVTVVTDLVTPHASWRSGAGDLILAPTAAAAARMTASRPAAPATPHPTAGGRATAGSTRGANGGVGEAGPTGRGEAGPAAGVDKGVADVGLPVGVAFQRGPAGPREREALRSALGVPPERFLVVLTGGAEGCGRMARRAAALARLPGDVQVVVICGRNQRLRRRLDRLAARRGDRLIVLGFVPDMADWLRCADLVAGKAGPGTIAEATCCGAPLILTAQLPGQEKGNAAFVTSAGAGCYVPRVRRLAQEVARLHADPATLEAMRAASAALAHPTAATTIATALATLAAQATPTTQATVLDQATAVGRTMAATQALMACQTAVPTQAAAVSRTTQTTRATQTTQDSPSGPHVDNAKDFGRSHNENPSPSLLRPPLADRSGLAAGLRRGFVDNGKNRRGFTTKILHLPRRAQPEMGLVGRAAQG